MPQSTFRKKRSDTRIETIEKKYGRDPGFRGEKELNNFLKEAGYPSLTRLFKGTKNGSSRSCK